MEVPDYGIYAAREWPSTAKGQAAMITRMDADVGRLVGLLRELDIDGRTLVIFTSDNGPHSEGGHNHEFFNSNGPLRGFKRDLYEGGIRVPTIAWWPGRIQPGSVSDQPLAFYDFLPTACELAGIKPPEKTDGISFVPTLLGRPQSGHAHLYWEYGAKRALRMGNWKAIRLGAGKPLELYNLGDDIEEQKNVADQHPQVVSEIEQAMARESSRE
jgi:uncharacterized sulfatase